MGMLLTYHPGYRPDESEDTEQDAGPYADLTDEQVAEAYATNVGGRATKRETQEAALVELENTEGDQPEE